MVKDTLGSIELGIYPSKDHRVPHHVGDRIVNGPELRLHTPAKVLLNGLKTTKDYQKALCGPNMVKNGVPQHKKKIGAVVPMVLCIGHKVLEVTTCLLTSR